MDVSATSNVTSGYRVGESIVGTEVYLDGIPEPRDPESEGIRRLSDEEAATVEISEAGRAMNRQNVKSTADQIMDSFNEAADGFRSFISKIEMGGYSRDITIDDIDMSHIDKMQQTYKDWKNRINEIYDGEDREHYLAELDKAYDSVFENKMLDPIKRAYDNKLYFYRPDSEESMKSIQAGSSSKESLSAMVSGYMSIQASKRVHHAALEEGLGSFYDLLKDKSKWHDTEAIKGTVTETMKTYTAHRTIEGGANAHGWQKSLCDAQAKELADKFASEHIFDKNRYEAGISKGDKKLDINDYLKDFEVGNALATTDNFFLLDFSKINNLGDIMKKLTEQFAEQYKKEAGE